MLASLCGIMNQLGYRCGLPASPDARAHSNPIASHSSKYDLEDDPQKSPSALCNEIISRDSF